MMVVRMIILTYLVSAMMVVTYLVVVAMVVVRMMVLTYLVVAMMVVTYLVVAAMMVVTYLVVAVVVARRVRWWWAEPALSPGVRAPPSGAPRGSAGCYYDACYVPGCCCCCCASHALMMSWACAFSWSSRSTFWSSSRICCFFWICSSRVVFSISAFRIMLLMNCSSFSHFSAVFRSDYNTQQPLRTNNDRKTVMKMRRETSFTRLHFRPKRHSFQMGSKRI